MNELPVRGWKNVSFQVTVTISGGHPSLAGHFPNNPIVPGVVILGEVLNALRTQDRGTLRLVGVPSVKFLSPLRPRETLAIRLEDKGVGEVAFTCTVHERVIAVGSLEYHVDSAAVGEKQ